VDITEEPRTVPRYLVVPKMYSSYQSIKAQHKTYSMCRICRAHKYKHIYIYKYRGAHKISGLVLRGEPRVVAHILNKIKGIRDMCFNFN